MSVAGPWSCDTCGTPVQLADAIITMNTERQTHDAEQIRTYGPFRLVHRGASGPAGHACDTEPGASWRDVSDLIGADGLSRLLSCVADGPAQTAGHRPVLLDPASFVDLVRRLHVPDYEQARAALRAARSTDRYSDQNPSELYTAREMADVVAAQRPSPQ